MERAGETCIICGGQERLLLIRQEPLTVYACSRCGLGVLDPRPDGEGLKTLYERDYFLTQYDPGLPVDSPEMKKRLAQEDHRLRFFRRFQKRGRLLDVGCGMGYFLQACRTAGYEVAGVDISEDSAFYVRSELNIPVTTGPIEQIVLPESTFDVVTMWHFLEHTPDPRKCLDKARRWLKPRGLLAVDVPNYEGTDARKTRENWKGWQLPYHLYHFTPHTIVSLMEQYGFRAVRTKDYLSECMRERIEGVPLLRLMARPIARMYSGHSFAVLARKGS